MTGAYLTPEMPWLLVLGAGWVAVETCVAVQRVRAMVAGWRARRAEVGLITYRVGSPPGGAS